jgi:hypothetical protein
MSRAQDVYNIADNHARTVQVCIDRLHELGANEQLNRLTGRLQELGVRATPGDDDQDTKAARRERGRSQRRNRAEAASSSCTQPMTARLRRRKRPDAKSAPFR